MTRSSKSIHKNHVGNLLLNIKQSHLSIIDFLYIQCGMHFCGYSVSKIVQLDKPFKR